MKFTNPDNIVTEKRLQEVTEEKKKELEEKIKVIEKKIDSFKGKE